MILDKFSSVAYPIPEDRKMMSGFFDGISEMIFNHFKLWINGESYRFSEIEYYVSNTNHNDVFTHERTIQREFGRWYFHEAGVDITFGSNYAFASILIRGLRIDGTGERGTFISGPLNILKTMGNSFDTIETPKHDFYIKYSDKLTPTKWIKHQRIGLNRKKELEIYRKEYGEVPDKDELFYNQPYRYIAWLEPYHSFRNKLKVLEDEYKKGTDIKIIQGAFNYFPNFLKN